MSIMKVAIIKRTTEKNKLLAMTFCQVVNYVTQRIAKYWAQKKEFPLLALTERIPDIKTNILVKSFDSLLILVTQYQ